MTDVPRADWGPLVIPTDVDEALIAKLELWLPTYLARELVEKDLPELGAPTYNTVLESEEIMDHILPAVLVTTAETTRTRGGPSTDYDVYWRVRVSSVVRGQSARETRFIASVFEGAIRRAMIQKGRQDEGPVSSVKWMETKLTPVPDTSGKGRYLAAGIATYNVGTDFAAQGFGGPDIPNAPSYQGLATVTDVTTQVVEK